MAYFLEENAYLMFGEVKANYYVDGEPTDVSNEVQPNGNLSNLYMYHFYLDLFDSTIFYFIAAIETSVQNVTENHEFSAPRLSCNVSLFIISLTLIVSYIIITLRSILPICFATMRWLIKLFKVILQIKLK